MKLCLIYTFLLCSLSFIGICILVANSFHYNFAKYLSTPPVNGSEFDFIVVGSGSAGSVVARRLAETGQSVLLIEAGGPSHFLQGIMAFVTAFMVENPYDWGYKVEPNGKSALAYQDNGAIYFPRGKVLGGCSMLNWAIYVRGLPGDYDEWSDLGNEGWSYKDVLPYFKKSENYKGGANKYHGVGGPMGVQHDSLMPPASDILLQAMKELKHPIGDVNGELKGEGFWSRSPASLGNGWRMGTYRSFVEPLFGTRAKITVLPFAMASKLVTKDKKVIGVEINRFDERLVYYSNKEVIVSGGAVESPKLLMLSGIGPKDELAKFNIPIVANLPVGKNLQDHMICPYIYSTEKPGLTTPMSNIFNPIEYFKLFVTGDSKLSDNGLGVNGFIHSPINKDKYKRADVQIHTTPFYFEMDHGINMYKSFSFSRETYDQFMGKYLGKADLIGITPTLLRPKSRGEIRLKSADHKDDPIIDVNFLDHDDDVKTVAEGIKFAHSLQHTKAFKDNHIIPMDPDTIHCGKHKPESQEYFECYARHWCSTVYHPVGTCTMSKGKDSVVDERLKVRGVMGLRVIDASIMPRVVSGNTNAPSIMIGEKGADMVIIDWKLKVDLDITGSGPKDEL